MLDERRASGSEYLALVTELLQAARRRSAYGGVWEAADMQWSWRKDQHDDPAAASFWFDGDDPVAAVVSTDRGSHVGLDILRVDPESTELLDVVWPRVIERCEELAPARTEMFVDEKDEALATALSQAGFVATDDTDRTAWMDAASRPSPAPVPPGFRLTSRADVAGARPHHMIARSGPDIARRLDECSLYRADLDLVVYDDDSDDSDNDDVAAYGLFWADPRTRVGLVEPMRTEDAFQRRGLARAVLTAGLERLAAAGCERLKISYEPGNGPARHVYLSSGFTTVSSSRTWARGPQQLT